MRAELALLLLTLATWAHLGFQATVSTLVYPVLVATPIEGWRAAHDRHSRVITPLVVVGYAGLVLGSVAALATAASPAVLVSVAGVGLSLGTTALVAAPLHGRLGSDVPTPERLRRLVVADRWRTAGAVVAAAASAAAWV